MRVLFLTHSYPRRVGDAAGSFLLNLAVALREQGIVVRVVAPGGPELPGREELQGIPVRRFRYGPRHLETLAYAGNMAEQVRESALARLALLGMLGAETVVAMRERRAFHPHLLHAHWWFPSGLVGALVSATGRLPLVTTMHGSDVRLAAGRGAARRLLAAVMRRSAGVTTVSRWLADQVTAMAPRAHPVVAPMPVASDLFTPGEPGGRDPQRLLFVGRLNRQKGIADLICALTTLDRPWHLDVVGDGPDGPSLRQLATTSGVAGRVSWLGAVHQHELPALYRRARALVVPSVGEGLGLVAVESLLCETPVVAYDSGGTVDVVRHGASGLLVPPGDVGQLSSALGEILGNPERAAAMGRAGRLLALGAFAPTSVARRYADVYRAACAR